MQNVTPFPSKQIDKNKKRLYVTHSRIPKSMIKKKKKVIKEKSNQTQPFSYIKMTLAVVIGNGIAIAGLFMMFLLYLSRVTLFID